MVEKHIDTAKVACLRVRNSEPELLLLLHKPRENTVPQKNGKQYPEKLRWGFPGGQGVPKTPRESLIDIVIREAAEETEAIDGRHLELVHGMFTEVPEVHGPILPSQRDDGSETFQNHFYLIILSSDTEIGKIDPGNEEIIRAEWFLLNNLPTPDDQIPFTQTQFFGLEELFVRLAQKWARAVPWMEIVQKQVDEYQARRDRYRR